MKHKLSKSVVVLLVACIACVLAFGATLAKADVDSRLGGNNVLLVNVDKPESEIKDAVTPQVNVYRVATGSKDPQYDTYNYTFDVPAFAALRKDYDPKTMKAESWRRMAEAAQKIVSDGGLNADASAAAGESITGLTEGIYLVMLPDTWSSTHTFTFSPALVAVPGKVGDGGAPVYNTGSGDWTNSTNPVTPVRLTVKWSMATRYGKLKINKTVEDFSGEAASFVFHVVDTDAQGNEGTKYNEYATVQYTAEGEKTKSAVLSHIPAGLVLNVYEEYPGGRYSLVSVNDLPIDELPIDDDPKATVTIFADQENPVFFTNKSNGSAVGGHGIENHFEFHYDEEKKDGDWNLVVNAIDTSEYVPNDQG